MPPFAIEITDVIIFAMVVVAVTAWYLYTLDRDMARVEKLEAEGRHLPWRFRQYAGKSKKVLQADLIGKGAALFLMLIGFAYLRTMGLSLGYRLAASLALAVLLYSTLPRLAITIARKFSTNHKASNP